MDKILTVVGRYTEENDLDIEGTSNDLEILAEILRQDGSNENYLLNIPSDISADPYYGFIGMIRVQTSKSLVCIWRENNVIAFTGSERYLAVLSDNIQWLARQNVTCEHMHIDYYPDHPYLDPCSLSLVITCRNFSSAV